MSVRCVRKATQRAIGRESDGGAHSEERPGAPAGPAEKAARGRDPSGERSWPCPRGGRGRRRQRAQPAQRPAGQERGGPGADGREVHTVDRKWGPSQGEELGSSLSVRKGFK